MLRQSDENDTVVVFLSGHGANDNVQGEKKYLFLSSDTSVMASGGWRASSVLSWAALEEGLGKARGRRLLFVDTCHAGNAYSAQIVKNAYDDNIAVFSAVDRDAEAQVRSDIGHGVFTYVVVRALNGEAARDKESRAERWRCTTAVAAYMEENRPGRRRAIRTPSSTAAIPPKRSHAGVMCVHY